MELGSPILIIGAGRSGTNFLSHVFEQDPRFWNSYENRYIWNYRQHTLAHDVRRAEEATSRVRRFIRSYFDRVAREKQRIVVDKTPSNIFRVGFVHAVLPDAKIVHIIRDGRDNVVSRRHEWFGGRQLSADRSAGRSARYRLAFVKQRLGHLSTLVGRGNLPVSRWPTFLRDNASSFVANLLGGNPRRYGERFPGMQECLDTYGLLQTGAIQWRMGVMHAVCEGRRLPASAYMELKYEDLLGQPEITWERLCDFLDLQTDGPAGEWLLANARRDNFNKWHNEMTESERAAIEPHIRPTLEFLGYLWE